VVAVINRHGERHADLPTALERSIRHRPLDLEPPVGA
jgi:hypothetical protein